MKSQWLKWILVGLCGVLGVGGVAIVLRKPEPPPPYQERVYASTKGVRIPYRHYVPPNYDAKQKYPLVIWLHGYDAIGTDNLIQIGRVCKSHPIILISASFGPSAVRVITRNSLLGPSRGRPRYDITLK
jgi:hypothetical protein